MFLFHLLVVYTLVMQGSSALTPVFVQTGKDLTLNVTSQIPHNFKIWLWQYKDDTMVTFSANSEPEVESNFTGRIQLLESIVKLKHLKKSDSGIYSAKLVVPTERILTQYNITVQDQVSPPHLTFTCEPSTSSYILTVTCMAGDSSINCSIRCENQHCKPEGRDCGGITKSGSYLHIYQLNKSIICNHSNQVSKADSKTKIEDLCTQHRGPHFLYVGLIGFILVPIVACFAYHKCKKAGNKVDVDNTIYAVPMRLDQTEKLKKTVKDEGPCTTYSLVGPSTKNKTTKTPGNYQPETINE